MAQSYVDAPALGEILKEAIKNVMVTKNFDHIADAVAVKVEGRFTSDEVNNIKNNLKPSLYGISKQIHMDLESLIPWTDNNIRIKLSTLALTSADVFKFYITGGYIASSINGTDANDVDIYFETENVIKFWHWLFNEYFPSNKKPKNWNDFVVTKLDNKEEYNDVRKQLKDEEFGNTVFVTSNAITIEHKMWSKKCQFIIGWHGTPKAITEKTFDMAHCMAYYSYKPYAPAAESVLTISPFIYRAAKNKMMYFNRPTTPGRLKKYYDRGYNFGESWYYKQYDIHPSDSTQTKEEVIERAMRVLS